ncbi:MAG TPA: 50S ribosomal protein L11 methyltransferase [Ferruginibacter sp.]|nr:50S ribosomal protein L11 methyltransferase [Ferruginibacter sp.]HMP21751.1 50S ribosomal protein L11 methyltransferase [Ferruginibacter sp.]
MNYFQFDFEPHTKDEGEQLIALLAEQGFDGFEEDGFTLIAFIPEANFNQEAFEAVLAKFEIMAYTKSSIENINWNQKWESEYEPVVVGDFVGIRAQFHQALQNVQYEIVITPKMSFGTGHHATTWMMMKLMEGINFTQKKVLDFGTGTGVLAILAEKMGAAAVLAIDYDEWSITNAIENCEINQCLHCTVQQADAVPATGLYDIILANINLNVLLANMPALAKATQQHLLISGILKTDEQAMVAAAAAQGLHKVAILTQKDWIAIHFEK